VSTHDIIVVGTSAGGVEALKSLFSALNAELQASVFVVQHFRPHEQSFLPSILQRRTSLHVEHALDGEEIEPGRVYIAPPDRHMLIAHGHIHLSSGPRENRTRPAINPLFRSAALAYGPRVIGVILTGMLDDGTVGLWEIKRRGGIAVVQSPDDAQYRQMPESAIQNVSTDYQVPIDQMGHLLISLAKQPSQRWREQPEDVMQQGEKTSYTCPECHGPLQRFKHGPITEFKCRVGHSYSPENALAAHAETEERVLWSAIEHLEEGADLVEELGSRVPADQKQSLQSSISAKRELAKTIRTAMEESMRGETTTSSAD
jgi:two-component system, chemotaxis family, protein-glutamate methylesterase/glutaminase